MQAQRHITSAHCYPGSNLPNGYVPIQEGGESCWKRPPACLTSSALPHPSYSSWKKAQGGIVMQQGSHRRSPLMAPLRLCFHASEGGPKATAAVQGGRAPTSPLLVPRALGGQAGLWGQSLHQAHQGTLSAAQGSLWESQSRRDSHPYAQCHVSAPNVGGFST